MSLRNCQGSRGLAPIIGRLCSQGTAVARGPHRHEPLSESPKCQGDALCDLGDILKADGRRDDAADAYRRALACYESKRIVPLARRARERLETLAR